jgi:hypothetical protein
LLKLPQIIQTKEQQKRKEGKETDWKREQSKHLRRVGCGHNSSNEINISFHNERSFFQILQ